MSSFRYASINPDAVTQLIQNVSAEIIMPRFEGQHFEIGRKPDRSIVTQADRKAEEELTRRLEKFLPSSFVLGEECTSDNPAVLGNLRNLERVWTVDPIDGTTQFASKNPDFGTMVSLIEHGTITHAWIYMPAKGLTAVAQLGQGAWLNGKKVQLPEAVDLSTIRGRFTFRWLDQVAAKPALLSLQQNFPNVTPHNDNAISESRRLLERETQFLIRAWETPWDVPPNILLCREAGGHAGFIGNEKGEYDPYALKGTVLFAPKAQWQELRDTIFAGPRGLDHAPLTPNGPGILPRHDEELTQADAWPRVYASAVACPKPPEYV